MDWPIYQVQPVPMGWPVGQQFPRSLITCWQSYTLRPHYNEYARYLWPIASLSVHKQNFIDAHLSPSKIFNDRALPIEKNPVTDDG